MKETDKQQPEPVNEPQHLSTAGASMLAGDGLMYWAARLHGKNGIGTTLTSAGWGVGGLGAFFFGKAPQDRVVRIEAQKMCAFLQKNGIDIPRTVSDEHPLLQPRGVVDHVLQFCYTFPSEILNGIYAAFSLGMIYDGVKTGSKSLIGGGASVIAGAAIGTLIKEDPRAREKARDGNIFQKAWARVQEKPLRAAGAVYMVNDAFLAAKAYEEFKTHGPKDKRYLVTSAAVAAYGIGNILLWNSSRDNTLTTPFRPEDRAHLRELAVEIIAAQPKPLREKTFELVNHYLIEERDVTMLPDALRNQMTLEVGEAQQRRIDKVAERSWKVRAETQKHAENREHISMAK